MYKVIWIVFISSLLLADNDDVLLHLSQDVFPGYMVEIKDFSYNDIDSLINNLQSSQYSSRSLQKRLEQTYLNIQELKKSYVPQFNLGANQQKIDIKERLVSIYTEVPIAWDNANPDQIDITLPNGGHGILWLPQPTEYAWRNFDLNASRPYESNSMNFNTGLHYEYHSGISIDVMNLNLNKRFSPENYGYSWYSSIENSISIPVLKLFNRNLSPRETNIENIKYIQKNLKISMKLNENEQKKQFKNIFLKLYLSWEKQSFYQKMIDITNKQNQQVIALSDENHLTVSEKISIENELKSYKSAINLGQYEIINYAFELKKDGNELIIFKPRKVQLEQQIFQLEKEEEEYLNLTNLDKIIKNNPRLKIIENNLKRAKSELKLISKFSSIQLDLIGSVSAFTSSDLGYKYPDEAIKKVCIDPDGFNTSVGMMFSMPLSFTDYDYRYQSSIKDYQISYEEYLASKTDIIKNYHSLRINLLNKKENLRSRQDDFKYSEKKYLIKKDFFELKRVSSFEYNSYLKEKLKSELYLKEAEVNYIIAQEEFMTFINVNLLNSKTYLLESN